MAEKVNEQNRRADNVNPLRSGMRTGNPQLRTQKHHRNDKKSVKRRSRSVGKIK